MTAPTPRSHFSCQPLEIAHLCFVSIKKAYDDNSNNLSPGLHQKPAAAMSLVAGYFGILSTQLKSERFQIPRRGLC